MSYLYTFTVYTEYYEYEYENFILDKSIQIDVTLLYV